MRALLPGHWLLLLFILTLTAITASPLGYCHDKVDGTVYPIAGTCITYIYCLNENAIVLTCPVGQGFSQASRGCLPKAKSDCTLQTTTLPTNEQATNTTRANCLANEQRTENKVACSGQPFGELVPYPGNCSRYLVCNCEYPTVMNCSGGLWFNNEVKVCDWPQNVNCNSVIKPPVECTPPVGINVDACHEYKDGTLQRYPYNCNSYVNCTLGCPVLKNCDLGKVFNDLLKICDTPDTATCEDEPIPTTTPSSTNEPTTSTDDPTTPHICAEPPFGVENYFCTHQPEGSFHNYPYNCTAYVECKEGCSKLDYCEPGKVFNNNLEICDTPNSVVCRELPYPGSTTTEAPVIVTESPTTSPNLPPLINPTSCLNRPDHTLVPYPDNCAQYIECMNNGNVLHTCPEGSVFNPDRSICDQSLYDSCYGITTDAPTSAMPSIPPVVYEKCLNSPKGTTYPYTSDCQHYYYCWGNNTSSLLPCPNNNYYNPYTGNCGPDVSSSACQESVTTVSPTKSPETVCKDQPAGSTYAIQSNCAQYTMCMGGGSSTTLNCPNNNYYNPKTGNCGPYVSPTDCQQTRTVAQNPVTSTGLTPTNQVLGITETADICDNIPNFSIVPDALNCSQFIVCMNREPMFVECSVGEYFDPSIGNCDSTATSETCTTWQYTAPPIPPTTIPTLLGICGNLTKGELLAYPGNCTKYIVCVNPAPVAFTCQNSWYFNVHKQQCEQPADSGCTDMGVVTPPSGITNAALPNTDICNGATNGTTFPYTQNCQMFIRCSGNNFYLYDICNNQGYYDSETRECGINFSTKACSGDISSSTPSPTEPPELPGVCSGQTPGSKIPYPYNCSKYIVCVLPIPIGYDCGENLEFNAELQECTNPEDANCVSGGGSIGGTTTTKSSTEENTTNKITTTSVPKTCADMLNNTTMPYPEDCSKYIVCQNGQPMLEQCDANSYYNIQAGRCDKQTTATACQESDLTTASMHSTETTTEPFTEETTGTATVPKTCADKPNGSTLPYPDDCSKYYYCLNGQQMIVQCMPNQYYNVQTGNCDSQTSATACRNSDTTTLGTTEIPLLTTTTTNSETTFAASTTTETENITNESTDRWDTSTTPGITSIPEFSTTVTDSTMNSETTSAQDITRTTTDEYLTSTITTTGTATVPKTCADKPNGSTLPYPDDCSKYYYCLNGQQMIVQCMPNQYYNVQTGNCDSQTSATACKNSDTTTLGTTEIPLLTTTTTNSETTFAASTTTETETITNESTDRWDTSTTPGITSIPEFSTTVTDSTMNSETTSAQEITRTTSDEYLTSTITTTIEPVYEKCVGQSKGTTFSYIKDCSLYYYCWGNNTSSLLSCPFNNYYNPQSGNCGPEPEVSSTACQELIITTTSFPVYTSTYVSTSEATLTTNSHTTLTVSTTKHTTDESTTQRYTSTTEEIPTVSSAPETCTSLSNNATLPYPTDCSKYITCMNGTEFLTNCMPGQYFNVHTGNCDSQTSETACKNYETTTQETTSIPETSTTVSNGTTVAENTSYPPITESTTELLTTINLKTTFATSTAEYTTEQLATTDKSTTPLDTSTTEAITTTSSAQKTCADLSNNATLPYPKDCSKYITCMNGNELLTNCMPGQYFNVQTGNCDSQTSETACRNDGTTTEGTTSITTSLTTVADGTTDSENTSAPAAITTTTGESLTSTTTTTEPNYGKCISQSKGTTFPYIEDCSLYYYCWGNNTSSLLSCPFNNYYNPQSGNCGPESEVSSTACEENFIKTTLSVEFSTSSTTTPISCVNEPNGTTLPYVNDCSKYIICLNGNENMAECIPNTFYNIHTGNCDRQSSDMACHETTTTTVSIKPITPETSTNKYGTTMEDTSTIATTISAKSTSTAAETTYTTTLDIITSTIVPNSCTDKPNGKTLPYLVDCSEYIICWNDHEILTQCMPNKYYNVFSGNCDSLTSDTSCRDITTVTTSEQTTYMTTSSPEVIRNTTTNENATDNVTDIPDRSSSTISMTTISTESTMTTTIGSTSPTKPNACTGLESGTTLPYLSDCSRYIFCYNNKEIFALCMPNSYYDIYSGYCNEKSSNSSCLESTTTTLTTESTFLTKTSSEVASTSNYDNTKSEQTSTIPTTTNKETTSNGFSSTPAEITFTFETTTSSTTYYTSSSVVPNSCTGIPNGKSLPYLNDCSKYIICWNNQVILTQCMPKSYYNILTGNCDTQTSNSSCLDSTTTQASDETTNTTAFPIITPTDGNSSSKVTSNFEESTSSSVMTTYSPVISSTTVQNSCTDEESGTTLPYLNDCSKYIFCLNNKEILANCMSNTYYDIYSGKCNQHTSAVACQRGTSTMLTETTTNVSPSKISTTTSYETTLAESATTPVTSFTIDTTKSSTISDTFSSVAPNICADVPNGTTLPYISDCSKYIICWNNEVVLTKCLPKTYFNIITGDCDAHTSSISCRDSTFTTPQATDETTNNSEQTSNTATYQSTTINTLQTTATSVDSTSTITPNSCTGLESGVTLPYLNDCSLYIFCFKNKEILAMCLQNTYYDIYTGNCNEQTSGSACRDETTSGTEVTNISNNNDTTTTDIITTPSDISTVTYSATRFTLETTTDITTDGTSTSLAPNACTGVQNGISLPYRSDCSKYIICWNNQVILTQCMPGTFYNPELETCNKQTSNSSCRDTTTTTSSSTQTMITTVVYDTSTTKDPPLTTAATSETTPPTDQCYDKPIGYIVPYPNNCSKYIICNDPLPVGHDCADNLEFNAEMQQCVLPDLANCSIKTSTTKVDPTFTTMNSISSTMDPPNTTVDPTLTTIDINICLNQLNGTRFPYGNNCSGYIYCENGYEKYQLCQTGYYYNPIIDACDNNVSSEMCRDFETTTPFATSTTDSPESTSTTRNPHTQNVCCGKPLNARVIYPDDCSKFITCEYPVPIVSQCPINTNFDTGTLQCIASNLAQCRASTGQSAIKVSSTTTTSMTPTITTPTNISLQGECSYLPSGSSLVYIGDCTKYNFCFGGQSYVLSCSGQFYFNPSRKQCVPTNSYKCPW